MLSDPVETHMATRLSQEVAVQTPAMRKLVTILGVPIDNLNMEQTLDRLEEFIHAGRATGKSHQVVTINADFVVNAIKDPELRYLLQYASLATADGMPLVWGARLLNVPLEGRVAGADLVPALAERAAQKGYSIFLLGAMPEVAARAAQILQGRNPGLKIVGIVSPPYSSILEMDPAIAAQIREARPDILLVAFGNPKQEKWIGMFSKQLKVPVMIGIGGSLDFIAGERKRAPQWMQKVGMEWLFRLLQEPGRLWKRYVVDLVIFGAFFLRQWWVMRKGGDPWTATHSASIDLQAEDVTVLRVDGSLTIANYEAFYKTAQAALSQKPCLLLDLSQADFLDSSAIGALVHMARQARENGGDLILVSVPANILETLSLLRLDSFFVIHRDVDSSLAERSQRRQYGAGYTQMRYMAYSEQLRGTTWMVVRCPRYFDQDTALEVQSIGQSLLEENPYLILDFSETAFLTSAGLAVINGLHRQAQLRSGELRVVNYSPEVQQVLEMVGFDKFLLMHRRLSLAAV